MTTLEDIGPTSNGTCLNHLAYAAKYRRGRFPSGPDAYNAACDYWQDEMNNTDRLAFDCFLVRMKDPLAREPGTPKHRFAERVTRMAMASLDGGELVTDESPIVQSWRKTEICK